MAKHDVKVGRTRWALESAQAILPDVRERTERAVGAVDRLDAARQNPKDAQDLLEIEGRIQEEISRWIREMEALGVAVKGIWLVDFETGSGSFCWRWPERDLEWFHGADEGFGSRVRIQ